MSTVGVIVQCMYYDEFSTRKNMDPNTALEILNSFSYFQLGLTCIYTNCENYLINCISEETAWPIWQAACNCKILRLQERSARY